MNNIRRIAIFSFITVAWLEFGLDFSPGIDARNENATSVVWGNPPNNQADLSFSTFFGGSDTGLSRDITVDCDGNVYVTGSTASKDFPVTKGAYQAKKQDHGTLWRLFAEFFREKNDSNVFVAKFKPNGQLVWSTLIGGPNVDKAYAIEVDCNGFVYLGGRAGEGYPTTTGVLQPEFGGDLNPNGAYGKQDGFVTKLSPDGSSLVWSTYFGGDDKGFLRDIDIDRDGNVYVGSADVSRPFPHITEGVVQEKFGGGKGDAVIAKISSDGRRVVWATYLGGSGYDGRAPSVRVGPERNVYVAMKTTSSDIRTTQNAYDKTYNGMGSLGIGDAYLAKLNPTGSVMIFGTYLGGGNDDGAAGTHGLAVDHEGNAYMTGFTFSSDFPITKESYQNQGGSLGNTHDFFVSKFSPSGQLLASVVIGGDGNDGPEGIALSPSSEVYVTGRSNSNNFPITKNAFQPILAGDDDGIIFQLSKDLKTLLYSTYFGGEKKDLLRACVSDSNGNLFASGLSGSENWPLKNSVQQNTNQKYDAVVLGLSLGAN